MSTEIKEFEPLLALDGGLDGFACYNIILRDAHQYLVPGGVILLEMGFDQKEGLENIFEKHSQYASIEFIKDLAGHNRVVLMKKAIDYCDKYGKIFIIGGANVYAQALEFADTLELTRIHKDFEGDTKLGSKNIPADAIDKVQVLKNYNEVSGMRGVTNNEDNIALNIKLKNE